MLDWINCMLEFAAFQGIFFSISGTSGCPLKTYILYYVLGALASIYFVSAGPDILVLNITLYVAILLFSFGKPSVKRAIRPALCSVPFMLITEFILLSLLPLSSMQTDIGNFIANIVLLIIVYALLACLKKSSFSALVAAFFSRYFAFVLLFSIVLIVFGQVYLSRLTAVWSFLPGAITLVVFLAFLAVVYAVIRYQQSRDRLRSRILEEQMRSSEAFAASMRIQLHDYKHHIQYLSDQIQSTPDLSTLRAETAEYLDELDRERSFYDQLIAIRQPVFRAVLYGCFARCRKLGIPFQLITGDLLPQFPLKDYQLVEVLENLIANAIEHNLSIPEEKRYILITLSAAPSEQRFSIENPVDDIDLPLTELYKTGVSSKGDSHQGLGLASIRKTLASHSIDFSGSRNFDTGSIRFELLYEENYT